MARNFEQALHSVFAESEIIFRESTDWMDRIEKFAHYGNRSDYSRFGLTEEQAVKLLNGDRIVVTDGTGRVQNYGLSD